MSQVMQNSKQEEKHLPRVELSKSSSFDGAIKRLSKYASVDSFNAWDNHTHDQFHNWDDSPSYP